MRMMMLALSAVLLAAAPASAADPAQGRQLAQQWCANCHVIGGAETGRDTAPALPAIAHRYGQDQNWLRTWLTAPHPPMPDLHLSRQEIDDIVAYLSSLPSR